jgi:hypothetical protein
VDEVYEDNRTDEGMGDLIYKIYSISEEEVNELINNLPKGKATGEYNIPAEFHQFIGEKGLQIMTKLRIISQMTFVRAYLY